MGSWFLRLLILFLVVSAVAPVSAQRRRRSRRVQTPEATEAGFRLESLRDEGGLTADQAAELALSDAPSVAQARALAESASSDAGAALLELLPRINVVGRYTRFHAENEALTSGLSAQEQQELQMQIGGVDDPEAQALFGMVTALEFPVIENQYALTANVTVPVSDLFVTLLPAFLAADDLADARELELEGARATLEMQAKEAYYNYLRAKGSLAVAEASLQNAEESLRQVEAMARVGAVPGVDLRRVEAQTAGARVLVERARGGALVAERVLRTFLHLDDAEELSVGEDLTAEVETEARPLEELVRLALEKRPEVRAMRELVDARGSASTARAGARWPSVAVSANYEYANPNSRIIPAVERWRSAWDVSVIVQWSPTDALVQNARHSAASYQHEHAQAGLVALEDAVRVEATAAYRERVAAQAALEAAQAGVEAAEASYRGRATQLRAGAAVAGDLLDADAELGAARLRLLNAAVDVRIAEARLERALGE